MGEGAKVVKRASRAAVEMAWVEVAEAVVARGLGAGALGEAGTALGEGARERGAGAVRFAHGADPVGVRASPRSEQPRSS